MKQLVVLSGKGGAGKTILTSVLATLLPNKILVDCDVDAANLHLLLHPEIKETHLFTSGVKAKIDLQKCTQCGVCRDLCRFDAINSRFSIDTIACEGCGLCYHRCEANAIQLEATIAGKWFLSETTYGTFVHAELGIAQENSGKLVSAIKQVAKEQARLQQAEWILIDGSPGIGCPVVASLTGCTLAVVVIEASVSGLHDAKRVVAVAKHFRIPVQIVINRYDLNPAMTAAIETYCRKAALPCLGKIPFDKKIVEATTQCQICLDTIEPETRAAFVGICEKI